MSAAEEILTTEHDLQSNLGKTIRVVGNAGSEHGNMWITIEGLPNLNIVNTDACPMPGHTASVEAVGILGRSTAKELVFPPPVEIDGHFVLPSYAPPPEDVPGAYLLKVTSWRVITNGPH